MTPKTVLIILGALLLLVLAVLVLRDANDEIEVPVTATSTVSSETPTDSQNSGRTTQADMSDQEFRSNFVIRGQAESAPPFDTKTYYMLTDKAAYVVTYAKFSGDGADLRISGGDAYVIQNADLATFEILPSFIDANPIAKDKNHVYLQGRIVQDANAATFRLGDSFTNCEYTDGTKCFNFHRPGA